MEMDQHDTASILIKQEEMFLLVRRGKPPEKGFWAVPGGHVDAGETAWQCAVRECREEAGEAEIEEKPFFIFVHDVGIGHRHRAHVFRGKLLGRPRAGTDAAEVKWFSLEGMGGVELTHYTKKILNFLLFGDIRK